VWNDDFGNPGDEFFTGDFNGDGLTDLAFARAVPGTDRVRWYFGESEEMGFRGARVWAYDVGDPGDEFLAGDYDGDGWTDFAYVEARDSGELRWYVAKSTDLHVSGTYLWGSSFGEEGDIILR
jgi:hypothetical protein